MQRKTSIGRWCYLLAGLVSVTAQASSTLLLDGPTYTIELDSVHGCVTRVAGRAGALDLNPPADLAENFRLVVEDLHGRRTTVSGVGQALTRTGRMAHSLQLDWDGPLADAQGAPHDIAVRVTVSSDETAVTFHCDIQNRSAVTIVEVWYAMLAGLEDFVPPEQRAHTAFYPPPAHKMLALPFGDYALAYPSQLNMGFLDINNAASNQGLYIGLHDPVARFKRFQFHETKKGSESTITACVVQYPFIKPGETFQGTPVVYRPHSGDWRAGARIYREWFIRTFGLMDPSQDWIRRESFFQMIMMMLPEGNINYTFQEVPQLARDGLKYGVRSLQLAGWQRGGHDNGYPYYEPDPRLGSWDDIAEAIRACHELGVKVYFFVNFQPVMMDLEWYREELQDYVSLNAFGETSWIAGWGMGTLASRMGDTVPLMAFADVAFPRMGDILTEYFVQLAKAGADGLHVDKMFPAALDFNPGLSLKPDTAPWEGAVQLMERITRECGAVNPEFRMSFECNWDRILPYGNATWWAGNMTSAKAVFPEVAETVGHYMPYDFLGINRDVRLGYAVMVSPFNFNRSMDDKPWRMMARYIREVKRIRDSLTDIVYLGGSLPNDHVRFGDHALTGGVLYSGWQSLKDGRRACVLTNDTRKPVNVTFLGFDGNENGPVEIQVPFENKARDLLPVRVRIPAEGIAFVAEEGRTGRPIVAGHRSRRFRTREKQPKAAPPFDNADFECGDLRGWIAAPNWRVDNNAAGGWYSGWGGQWFAWSGQGGEPATGSLRSPVFRLARPGVEVWLAGWADVRGLTSDRWNYITLNLADGTELDRRYAPNSVTFSPVVLSGAGYVDDQVYIEAVDDAPEGTFSMLCIDNVLLVDAAPERELSGVASAHPAKVYALENALCRVEVDRQNGAIRRILDKKTGLELIREPRLADNFDFTLPIRKAEAWMSTEANFIHGRDQRLTSCRQEPDGLVLEWAGPFKSVFSAAYDVSVRMRIALKGEDIVFSLRIDNRTALEIGEVYYPILGGMQGLGRMTSDLKDTVMALPVGAGLQSARPFHTFQNMSPFGTLYPEQYHRYPDVLSMPWLDLYSPRLNRGVYFGVHDPVARNKILHLQLLPGAASQRADGNWPRPEELKGAPSGVRLCLVQIPYEKPGQAFEAAPVVLRFHEGDWHAAAAAYGHWASTQDPAGAERRAAAPCPDGPYMFPCGRIPYAQLPEQARAALAAGVHTLLLTDWKADGQHDGLPRFELDPSLGTRDGLWQAIEQCHALGVRVVFLVNLQAVDPRTDWYRDELHRYASVDRWGVPATWGERRFHLLSPAFPAIQQLLAEQTRALAALGADGVHLRDLFPTAMDFNPNQPLSPDRASWEGGLTCVRMMLDAAREVRPDFQLSTHQIRDRFMNVAPISEAEAPEVSPFKEAFPQWRTFQVSQGS